MKAVRHQHATVHALFPWTLYTIITCHDACVGGSFTCCRTTFMHPSNIPQHYLARKGIKIPQMERNNKSMGKFKLSSMFKPISMPP